MEKELETKKVSNERSGEAKSVDEEFKILMSKRYEKFE